MGAHSTLLLKAGSTVVLSQYVNQKVELTGTMDASAGSMTSTGSTPSGTAAGTTARRHHGHDRRDGHDGCNRVGWHHGPGFGAHAERHQRQGGFEDLLVDPG